MPLRYERFRLALLLTLVAVPCMAQLSHPEFDQVMIVPKPTLKLMNLEFDPNDRIPLYSLKSLQTSIVSSIRDGKYESLKDKKVRIRDVLTIVLDARWVTGMDETDLIFKLPASVHPGFDVFEIDGYSRLNDLRTGDLVEMLCIFKEATLDEGDVAFIFQGLEVHKIK